jgi:hypothetical protein
MIFYPPAAANIDANANTIANNSGWNKANTNEIANIMMTNVFKMLINSIMNDSKKENTTYVK